MTQVVVDASVVVATLMADGSTRHVLLHAERPLFVAPPLLFEEVQAAMPRIAARAREPRSVVRGVLRAVEASVTVVPGRIAATTFDDALARCREADAVGDEAYVAVALLLGAPVWSLDRDFDRIRGVQRLSTAGVARLLVRGRTKVFKPGAHAAPWPASAPPASAAPR